MAKSNTKRIGIFTAGGDCPGLNAAIRGVAKAARRKYGIEVIGIYDGFQGLIENRWRALDWDDLSGILTIGGTMLRTSRPSFAPQTWARRPALTGRSELKRSASTIPSSRARSAPFCCEGSGPLPSPLHGRGCSVIVRRFRPFGL